MPSRARRATRSCGEPLGAAGEIGGVGDRLGKAEAHPPHRRFAQRRQRFRQVAERLVEAARHRFAKAAGERVARHRIEFADPLEPDPAQPGHGCRIEAQCLDRQRCQRRPLLAWLRQCRLSVYRREARQRPGGAQRAGNRDAMIDILAHQAPREIGGERRLAAP